MIPLGVRTLVVRVVLAGAMATGSSCSEPATIERLTVVNGTAYDVFVRVTDAKRDGWTLLGNVRHGSSSTNESVGDEGATWIFDFQYGGVDAGELVVSRAELRRNRWRVEVPAIVGDRLRKAGLERSP